MNKKLVLVGCGKMGHAILTGLVNSNLLALEDIYVVHPSKHGQEKARALNVNVVASPDELPVLNQAQIIFAVKPNKVLELLPSYKTVAKDCVFMTVVAGVESKSYTAILGNQVKLVRLMPNTPIAIGKGVVGFWANQYVQDVDLIEIKRLLAFAGLIIKVDLEEELHAITGIAGSGSAYIFYLLEVIGQLSQELGLQADISDKLALQIVQGAVELAAVTEQSPAVLRSNVTSPNGTTEKALKVLMDEESGLKPLWSKTIKAAIQRSIEISEIN